MPFARIPGDAGFLIIPGLLDGLHVLLSAEFRILPNHFELPTLQPGSTPVLATVVIQGRMTQQAAHW